MAAWLAVCEPGAAATECRQCLRYVYEVDADGAPTGEVRRLPNGDKWPRPAQVPPDCSKCPKESPDNEELFRLTRRQRKAWKLYRSVRAAGAAPAEWLADDLIREWLRAFGEAYEALEAKGKHAQLRLQQLQLLRR